MIEFINLIVIAGLTAFNFGMWQESSYAGTFAFSLAMLIYSSPIVVRK